MKENLAIYFQEIGKFPLLTVAQEKTLAKRIRRGDKKAKQKLISSNLRLVVVIAKRYPERPPSLTLPDFIQEGNLGLFRAAGKFDGERGCRFFTYATYWIREAIQRAIMNGSRIIRVPISVRREMGIYEETRQLLKMSLEREPSVKEIALAMGIPEAKASHTEMAFRKTFSLECSDKDDSKESFCHFGKSGSEGFSLSQGSDELFLKEEVSEILESLPGCQRKIISMRFGLSDGRTYTLTEIAGKLNLTRARVKQLQNSTLAKLRKKIIGVE